MKRLRRVLVGAHSYTISYKAIPDLDAYTVPSRRRIVIDKALRGTHLAERLFHEITHAIWEEWAVQNSEHRRVTEERVVSLLSAGWCAVLVTNPALLAYLARMLRKSKNRDR